MASLNNAALASMLQKRESGYLDVISRQLTLLDWLRKNGGYVGVGGGTQYEWSVFNQLNTDEATFDGWDVVPNVASDDVDVAIASYKSYYKSIAINGTEMDLNNGERIFDLMEQKEEAALASLRGALSTDIYLDGTRNGSKAIVGLGAICSATPTTGTLFNINRATAGNEFWRNQRVDTNAVAFDYSDQISNIRNGLEQCYTNCGRQNQIGANRYPNLIICTENYRRYFSEVVDHKGQRYVNTNKADSGFDTLAFRNASIIEDQDCPADAGSGEQAFLLNSDCIRFIYIKSANFKTSAAMPLESQDGFARRLIWRGALIARNPGKLGVHEGISATQA
jgi:hypothetical protein